MKEERVRPGRSDAERLERALICLDDARARFFALKRDHRVLLRWVLGEGRRLEGLLAQKRGELARLLPVELRARVDEQFVELVGVARRLTSQGAPRVSPDAQWLKEGDSPGVAPEREEQHGDSRYALEPDLLAEGLAPSVSRSLDALFSRAQTEAAKPHSIHSLSELLATCPAAGDAALPNARTASFSTLEAERGLPCATPVSFQALESAEPRAQHGVPPFTCSLARLDESAHPEPSPRLPRASLSNREARAPDLSRSWTPLAELSANDAAPVTRPRGSVRRLLQRFPVRERHSLKDAGSEYAFSPRQPAWTQRPSLPQAVQRENARPGAAQCRDVLMSVRSITSRLLGELGRARPPR